jgi:hydrogenase assembly chaperone HypC/HupF
MGGSVCLTIPMKVLEIRGDRASVEAAGRRRDVDVSHVAAREGGYVLVLGGVAVAVLEPEDATRILSAWDDVGGTGPGPDA